MTRNINHISLDYANRWLCLALDPRSFPFCDNPNMSISPANLESRFSTVQKSMCEFTPRSSYMPNQIFGWVNEF